jgi:hypothetical protein
MRVNVVAGSLLSGLVLVASPLAAQVSADVVVRSGAVAGHVAVGDGYSTYRRPPARRVVIVERDAPRLVVVERMHRHLDRDWRRFGYRPVTIYYVNGRYYDRPAWRRGVHEVVVYERGGRYYTNCDEHDRHDHDRHHDRDRHHRHGHWDD